MFDQTKKASYVHNINKFMSAKCGKAIRTQSVLEFDFCYHLEFNPSIKQFISQPLNYYYYFNNRRCRYTPDFEIQYINGESKFIEVKHSSKINKADFIDRFTVKKAEAKSQFNKPLLLVTEKQIRTEPLLSNYKLLSRYSGALSISEQELSLLKFIQDKKQVLLLDACKSLSMSEPDILIASLSLLNAGYIHTDIKSKHFDIYNLVGTHHE